MDRPTDTEIKVQLLAAPPTRWQRLWAAVDELRAPRSRPHASWVFPEPDAHGMLRLPYVHYSETMERIRRGLYEVGAIISFAWTDWDGEARYPNGEGLRDAPVGESVRMLTLLIRAERLTDGTILRALEDGTFLAALDRLRRWYERVRVPHAAHVHGPPHDSWAMRQFGRARVFLALHCS
ncbi:DUF6508 domain-containing protein [Nocardia stercoris]|nr:DUF6508 domain-containing protein [Nocardia stercoris]